MTPDQILIAAGKLFKQRQKVYGFNYLRVGAAMAALFPDGVVLKSADDHNRFHIFMLLIVKLSRYTVNWEKRGHVDSVHDTIVYSAMLQFIDALGPAPRTGSTRVSNLRRRPRKRLGRTG